ncbi:hypothetical protein pb186bvf_011249 [Paramecium bursaria]
MYIWVNYLIKGIHLYLLDDFEILINTNQFQNYFRQNSYHSSLLNSTTGSILCSSQFRINIQQIQSVSQIRGVFNYQNNQQ